MNNTYAVGGQSPSVICSIKNTITWDNYCHDLHQHWKYWSPSLPRMPLITSVQHTVQVRVSFSICRSVLLLPHNTLRTPLWWEMTKCFITSLRSWINSHNLPISWLSSRISSHTAFIASLKKHPGPASFLVLPLKFSIGSSSFWIRSSARQSHFLIEYHSP